MGLGVLPMPPLDEPPVDEPPVDEPPVDEPEPGVVLVPAPEPMLPALEPLDVLPEPEVEVLELPDS